jgi:hypothetical protein
VHKHTPPLATLFPLTIAGHQATARYASPVPLTKAEFHYSTDTSAWKDRAWTTTPARIDESTRAVVAELPAARPLVGFVTVVDDRGLTVSTPHLELRGN